MLDIIFSRKCEKFLKNLLPKHRKQIKKKLEELQKDPEPHDRALLKGITEQYWRTDIGEYRIIYQFDSENLTIYTIGKRNDGEAYKSFFHKNKPAPRLLTMRTSAGYFYSMVLRVIA